LPLVTTQSIAWASGLTSERSWKAHSDTDLNAGGGSTPDVRVDRAAVRQGAGIDDVERVPVVDRSNLLLVFKERLGVESLEALREDTPLREKAYREIERAYIKWDEPLAPPAKQADKLRPVYAPSALSPLPLLLSGRSGWKRSQPPH
jgi:hypothetical protein